MWISYSSHLISSLHCSIGSSINDSLNAGHFVVISLKSFLFAMKINAYGLKQRCGADRCTREGGRPAPYRSAVPVTVPHFACFYSGTTSHCNLIWGANYIWSELRIFLFITASRTALGPTQPPIQWVPGALSPRDVKLTTHIHLVPRSRMRGAVPPFPQ
jgi:hypothetical protein